MILFSDVLSRSLSHCWTLLLCRTSYDSQEHKHWLTVQKDQLVGRYLLQDNAKPAWQDGSGNAKTSTQEKIVQAVDAMIDKIDKSAGKEAGTK